MKVVSCEPGQMSVSPKQFNACTFNIIDKWDPNQHAKTCDTMFYLRDGTGAYVWDCDKWVFLDFTGYTAPDWKAKENQQGYIKNKPFQTLGNGLTVSEEGVLSVNVTPKDIGAASKEDLNEHINDTKNPHKVTAGQTGAYTKAESDINVINIITGKDKVQMTLSIDFINKTSDSYVENPNWSGAVYGVKTLPTPDQFKTELIQSRYEAQKKIDGEMVTVRTVAGTPDQFPCLENKWNMVEILKRQLGENFFLNQGAKDIESQAEIAKRIVIGPIESSVWGYGTCPSGFNLSIANLVYGNWQTGAATPNTTNSVKKITARNTAIPSINADGYLKTIVYTEKSTADVSSQIDVDYSNLVFSIEISMSDYLTSVMAHNHIENIATQDEVDIGQSPTKIVTPLTLAKYVNDNTVDPEELDQVFKLLTNVRKFTLDTSNSTCIATGSITFERVGYEVHFTGAFRTAKEITANSYIANKGITSLPDWLEAEGTVKNLITYSESDEIFRMSYNSRDLRSGNKVIPNDTWVYIQSGSYIVSESAREL